MLQSLVTILLHAADTVELALGVIAGALLDADSLGVDVLDWMLEGMISA